MHQANFHIGIDIGKGSFMAHFPAALSDKQLRRFNNDLDGRSKFIGFLTALPYEKGQFAVTMEATGTYSMPLCYELCAEGFTVYLVNPRGVKKFADARLEISKSDAKDAAIIAEYGEKMELVPFRPQSDKVLAIKQKLAILRQMKEQRTQTTNLMESLAFYPGHSGHDPHLQALKKELDDRIKALKGEVEQVAKEGFEEAYKLVTSVNGIGPAAAAALIVATNCFENFDGPRPFVKFVGACPRRFQSGTSLNRKGGMSRKGNPQLRALLYMAAMSARKYNAECRKLYERLLERGKSAKQALMAVINKLIRQVFAVVRSGQPYVDGFQRT
jgi:transposase